MVIWKREGPLSSLCSHRLDVSRAVLGPHLPDLMALTLKDHPPPFFFCKIGLFSVSQAPSSPQHLVPGTEGVSFPELGGSGVITGRPRTGEVERPSEGPVGTQKA